MNQHKLVWELGGNRRNIVTHSQSHSLFPLISRLFPFLNKILRTGGERNIDTKLLFDKCKTKAQRNTVINHNL